MCDMPATSGLSRELIIELFHGRSIGSLPFSLHSDTELASAVLGVVLIYASRKTLFMLALNSEALLLPFSLSGAVVPLCTFARAEMNVYDRGQSFCITMTNKQSTRAKTSHQQSTRRPLCQGCRLVPN